MSKPMTPTEINRHVAEQVGIPQKMVKNVFETFATLAYAEAANGVTVPGLGKIVLTTTKPRNVKLSFGPKAGQTVAVPAKTQVKFRVSKTAKDAILAAKA